MTKTSKGKQKSIQAAGVTNRLRERRVAVGFSQGELAARTKITRQALYAIEMNQYLPGTEVALRLASHLGCTVEDLFSFESDVDIIEAEMVGGESKMGERARVKVASVDGRLLAKPVSDLGEMLNYTVPADGLQLGRVGTQSCAPQNPKRVYIQLLRPQRDIEHQVVVAGCDPAIFLAGEHIRQHGGDASVLGWTMGSLAALQALKRGEVHVAGIHVVDHRSGDFNLPFLRKYLKGHAVTVVRFAAWQEGLLLKKGNPKTVRGIEDLARPDLRMMNREPGAGARLLLDYLLEKSGIASRVVRGYDAQCSSQLGVGRAIVEGKADVGIGAQGVGHFFDLDFIPLQEERYDLVIPTRYLRVHPGMQMFLDTLVTHGFRQEIDALGGYDSKEIGKIIE
ncbi:substrate-binding domain-containing protein [Candidatus Nitronereus thalassa]|uniref:Substrate-binding domain-containing protein n=1 Tax=Candidatus Nitronereus thalassa TaxID=3020898 RepID=A0ABU3K4Z2_9BACT|nr:substrate-binding domain-containing protein [Candidatus Nitronereus thalassa]MDT7041472.1 substrate-binding domain-containing protein [Candidatus Nitronereus thalassa]